MNPKDGWLTDFTSHVTLPIYINYLFSRVMAQTFTFNFMDDVDILQFVEERYGPEILGLYDTLTVGASKADFWRVLVLQKFGGVYMDLDAHLVWPLELIIEPEFDEIFLAKNDGNFTNERFQYIDSKDGKWSLEPVA